MNAHPNARRLDGLAAGGADPQAEAHLAVCAPCARYVEGLRRGLPAVAGPDADAFVAALALRADHDTPGAQAPARGARAEGPAPRPRFGPRARQIAFATGPLLAAAALLLLVLRPAPPGPPHADAPPALTPDGGPVRFKGEVALAVIRERGGEQERLVHEASVRAGDRIRLEVSSSAEGPLAAGVLADDGAWLPLLEAASADVGTHFSERSARFDDEPTEGFVLAGRPDEVERARTSRRFEGVATLRLRYERGP
jgi:hypothetical protein